MFMHLITANGGFAVEAKGSYYGGIVMLTDEQVAFLAREMGATVESIIDIVKNDPDRISGVCASIATEEVMYDENNDFQFNPKRLAMAEDIMEELM
jgi:hypothetical protein